MGRAALRLTVFLGAILLLAQAARADTVTLSNGDVLQGEVTEHETGVQLEHPVLGTLEIPKERVTRIVRDDGAATPAAIPMPPAPPPPTPCSPCAPCAEVRPAAPCAPACATESVEKCPRPWDLAIGLGLSNETGNTEKIKVNTDVEAEIRWRGLNKVHWRASAYYEESDGAQTEGKYFSTVTYTRRISPRGHLFGLWLVDRDDFADIMLRTGWFVGYGHDFIDTKATTFSGALGAGAIVEKRKNQPTLETAAALAQLEFAHDFAFGDRFEALARVIPYLDEVELSPWRLELRYIHPLRKNLDVTAGFLLDYVPEPPPGIESYDTKLTLGLRWSP